MSFADKTDSPRAILLITRQDHRQRDQKAVSAPQGRQEIPNQRPNLELSGNARSYLGCSGRLDGFKLMPGTCVNNALPQTP